MQRQTFDAPWSLSLKVISAFSTVLCLGVAATLVGAFLWDDAPRGVPYLSLGVVAIVAGVAWYRVLGYEVGPSAVIIHRPVGPVTLPLSTLRSMEAVPRAMRRSLRTFGNGGLFSFTGRFRNRTLGAYRAWVTDPSRTVVLRFADRTVVVSPGDPNGFVEAVRSSDWIGEIPGRARS